MRDTLQAQILFFSTFRELLVIVYFNDSSNTGNSYRKELVCHIEHSWLELATNFPNF